MTEEQAKKKWCPMVRHTKDNEGSFHTTNGQKSEGFQTCIASKCMLWRWEEDWTHTGRKIGYCGLAGM